MEFKPFVVEFEFLLPERGKVFVVAPDPDTAAQGALSSLPAEYRDAKVLDVSEYNQKPSLN